MSTTVPTSNPVTTTVLLGASTVIAQSLLLREAMAAMGGSETAWGVAMAVWLAGMGVGSRLGIRLGGPALARWLPIATLALAGSGVLTFRASPALLGAAAGEVLTTWTATWLWALAVAPTAVVGGLAFPVLAEALGHDGPGRAYALEASGALVGGVVLSLALVPWGTAAALLVALGLTAAATLWPTRRALGFLIALSCLVAAVPAGAGLERATWRWAGHPGTLGTATETRHQRLESSAGSPTSLYADGRLVASYPDPYSALPRAHLRMLLHPSPRRVLAVGCTADGSIEAMVRHPVAELLVVEEDPRLIDYLRRSYDPSFEDALEHPKVTALTTDPLRAIADRRDLDLVILADGDPTTLRANRTRTVEFFRSCRDAMTSDGVLVLRVGVADTYLGGTAGDLLATLASSLREVFPRLSALPGEEILLVAAMDGARPDPTLEELVERRLDRPEIGEQLDPAMIPLLVDEGRRPALEDEVRRAVSPPNTVSRPRAVRLANRLHEARSPVARNPLATALDADGSEWLAAGLVVLVVGLLVVGRSRSVPGRAVAAAFVVGVASMGWWLLLLAAWQATRGSVYAEIGALTGAFMAGVAAGGWCSLRSGRAIPATPWLVGGGVVLSLVIATGLPTLASTVAVPALLVIGGALTGATFPGLGQLAAAGRPRRGAGLAFAADEIGAGVAALVVGTVAIPWIGIAATAFGLAALGLAALPAVLRR